MKNLVWFVSLCGGVGPLFLSSFGQPLVSITESEEAKHQLEQRVRFTNSTNSDYG